MTKLILASASPRRSELMKQLGLSFEIQPSDIDEEVEGELTPGEFAEELSCKKALDIALKQKQPALVIGADTIVVKDGILGKPKDKEHARKMLRALRNSWHEVITGVTVVEVPGMRTMRSFEKTRVRIGSLDEDTIEAYIETGEPADKAGAYGIQGLGAVLVDEIQGCYFNVVGLPLKKLSLMLGAFGVKIL